MEMPHAHEERPPALDELPQIVEALVFAADEPVHADRIADVYAEVRGAARPTGVEIGAAVDSLNTGYEAGGHVVRINQWAEGYRMATIPEVAPFLKAFLDQRRSRRLSRSLMEALAVVAYKQPVTKPEVDFVRGVDSDYALRKLMELNLVDVMGRSDAVGRPLLYGTTSTFLDKFGMPDLNNLPNLREVEELLSDPAFSNEKARLLLRASLFDAPEGEVPESQDQPEPTHEDPASTESAAPDVSLDELTHANGNGVNGSGA